jgi:hypothetical protein
MIGTDKADFAGYSRAPLETAVGVVTVAIGATTIYTTAFA